MRATTISLIVLALVVQGAVRAAPANVFEWVAVAPIVVAGQSLGTSGKFYEFRVDTPLRGETGDESVILVNVRGANRDRDRELYRRSLKLDEGIGYALLLTRGRPRKADGRATYDLVRGIQGVRELPAEGREAFLAAMAKFIEIHDGGDDRAVWRGLEAMLEETNPTMIRTALEQYLKFRRGRPDLLPTLRPLLDHPSPELRERAAGLIAQILTLPRREPLPDAAALWSDVVARARRDPVVDVRVAATLALDEFDGDAVVDVLREIASDDPDQAVRYAAERLLFDRERVASRPGGPRGPGAADD